MKQRFLYTRIKNEYIEKEDLRESEESLRYQKEEKVEKRSSNANEKKGRKNFKTENRRLN